LLVSFLRSNVSLVRFFPNEASDLEPVVEMLHFQVNDDWWVSYVLTLWLAQLVMVPFDLDTIDSKKEHEILLKRLINIGQGQVSNPGKIRDVSVVLLAKILTRPDVIKAGETDVFLNWLQLEFQTNKDNAG